MKLRVVTLFALFALSSLSLSAQVAECSAVAGTYSTDGATTGTQGNWTLTSTTGATYSSVTYTLTDPVMFSDLDILSATFNVTAGGVGTGTPRFSVQLDTNGDSVGDGWMFIQLGDSPDFTGDNTEVNAYSGVNMIGNNDPARYDTSQFGGTTADTYTGAVTLLGNADVLAVMFVTDEGGTRTLTLNSINLCAPAPDLTISKTVMSADRRPGGTITYNVVVTNNGTAATSGTTTVTEQPGPGLTVTSMSGTGWTCNVGTLTCTSTDVIDPGESFGTIVVEATITATGDGEVTNTAAVSGGGDGDTAGATSSATLGIIAADVPTLDPRALAALVAVLALLGARRLFS